MFTVRETNGGSKKCVEGRSSGAEETSSSGRRRIAAERRQVLLTRSHGHPPSVRAHTTYASMHHTHHVSAR